MRQLRLLHRYATLYTSAGLIALAYVPAAWTPPCSLLFYRVGLSTSHAYDNRQLLHLLGYIAGVGVMTNDCNIKLHTSAAEEVGKSIYQHIPCPNELRHGIHHPDHILLPRTHMENFSSRLGPTVKGHMPFLRQMQDTHHQICLYWRMSWDDFCHVVQKRIHHGR